MKRRRFWEDHTYVPSKPLHGEIATKHLIVGGGVAGLFTAYFLLKNGETDITIIERDFVGMGSTGHSAGMLVKELETASWDAVAKRYGKKAATAYAQAQVDAQLEVAQIIKEGKIDDCGYAKDDFYLLMRTVWSPAKRRSEHKLRRALGMKSDFLDPRTLHAEFNTSKFEFGERLEGSISVNPLAFSHGVARYLRSRGVRIYENTPLITVKGGKAQTPNGEISFSTIVYARGTAEKGRHLVTYLTSIGVTRPLTKEELQSFHLRDKDMFLDEESRGSYHYGKITADDRILIGYGDVLVRSDVAHAPLHVPHYEEIKRFIQSTFGSIALEYAWSGVYSLHKKEVPFVKVTKRSATIAGAGTQLASIACASYVASRLLSKKHPLEILF
ncbi:FAD-binding oxidoreductase [Patescibacteria group bacterium]|nr:FAD-binding oxidoreductase [Patescibacteria group bacterium]MBU1754808.1 FAD-binding oxidoreductase [Patescibacteria group bacterium]